MVSGRASPGHGKSRPQRTKRKGGSTKKSARASSRKKPTVRSDYIYKNDKERRIAKKKRSSKFPKGQWFRFDAAAKTWRLGLKDKRETLAGLIYRLPEVRKAMRQGKTIRIVDGEKDVDRLWEEGIPATCCPHGSGTWKDEHSEWLRGADVEIIADKDGSKTTPPYRGQRAALRIQASLIKFGIDAPIFEAAKGKDASDHFDAGFGSVDFEPADLTSAPYAGQALESTIWDRITRRGQEKGGDDWRAILRNPATSHYKYTCLVHEPDAEERAGDPKAEFRIGDNSKPVHNCFKCTPDPSDEVSRHEFLGALANELSITRAELLGHSPESESHDTDRAVDGATFIFSVSERPPVIWGKDERVLWAEGEGLLIVGEQGLGKTTIAQQLANARLGIGSPLFLGFSVVQDERRVFYFAMDRPMQAARSWKRMVSETDADALRERLTVWKGPLPFNVVRSPHDLANFIEEHDAGSVVFDSVKDIAPGLASDEVGSAVNLAFQEVISRGIQLVGLHHQRKKSQGGKRTNGLDDVYGSTWITAGMGSVVLIEGRPGGERVTLTHLKQPAETVGPLTVVHDHKTGHSELHNAETDLVGLLLKKGKKGVTLEEAARHLFGTDDAAATQRARRRLSTLVEDNVAVHRPGERGGQGGGGVPARWVRVR